MVSLRYLFSLFFLFTINALCAQDTTEQVVPGRYNSASQEDKPYVILISADGFRYDLADKYQAKNLLSLRQEGVEAAYMRPAFPSLTFPNHYSIVTGLYPAHHGLVDNTFYDEANKVVYSMGNPAVALDSTYYGGTPLWVLAEKDSMLAASFYWVGSEVPVQNTRPTYYYKYSTKIGIDKRLEQVREWLQLPENTRPHFITFYFPEVDHEEHLHGIDSKEAQAAVEFVDESVGRMNAMVDSLHLPVSFIFVSDHGMTNIDTAHFIDQLPGLDTSKFIIPPGDALLHLYAKNKDDILPAYNAMKIQAKDFDVYLADSMPAKWHYSTSDDYYHRIGDIILIPHLPEVFNLRKRKLTPGKHGFDNYLPDMRATFYAWGPAFKQNFKIPAFDNVDVYPLIATILGLNYSNKIDGSLGVLQDILR
ncbi:MAG: ectonucleotide pyrophosphatase/phosphodiesterase [Ginsengibacter sp.]